MQNSKQFSSNEDEFNGEDALKINDAKFLDLEENLMLINVAPAIQNNENLCELERNTALILENIEDLAKNLEDLKQRDEARDREFDEMKTNMTALEGTVSSLKRNLKRIYGKRI